MSGTDVQNEPTTEPRISTVVPMSVRECVETIVVGAGIGLIITGLYLLFYMFVFHAVLCRVQSSAHCSQAPLYAMIVAAVVGSICGVALLVRLRIYRPLLISLAAIVSLWSIHSLYESVAWYWAFIIAVLLFALSYGLFAWVARIRHFVLALVVIIVLIVLIRWVFIV